jgi:hypothetical protein
MLALLLLPVVHASAAKSEQKFKEFIIGFEDGEYDADIAAKAGGHFKKGLKPLVNAITVKIPEELAQKLRENPAVKYVEEDAVAFIAGHATPSTAEYGNS